MFQLFSENKGPFNTNSLMLMKDFGVYSEAKPFPHAIFDNFFNIKYLRKIIREWPTQNKNNFEVHNDGKNVVGKTSSTYLSNIGKFTAGLYQAMASPDFLLSLESLTGIHGLIPDPYLFGGGLHETRQDGKLEIHVDFNIHPKLRFFRRVNVLIYLNEGWSDENQGWLEMWDGDGIRCELKILPIFNRMVVFSTSLKSYHGQPSPIKGHSGLTRKSIAFYYYSQEASSDINFTEHSTIWRGK
jgi:Rps23 Pro-64 3,4-dihydroxylase Tpa1-like proline 4-hydroxylase